MKIAVLADIHGNLTAFNAVLKKIKELKIDKIIVAGDHISDCPSPTQILDRLMSPEFICIKGNRENYILSEDSETSWPNYRQMDSITWTKKQLNKRHMDWIENLEEQRVISFEHCDSIRVVHGSTDDICEHLYKEKPKRLQEVLNCIDENVLICGHSHLTWSINIEDRLVINPGSVGVSFNNSVSADFAILNWEESGWNASHISVPYNIEELKHDFITSGLYEEGGIWGKLILKSLADGRNCNIEFINVALGIMADYGTPKGKYIPNHIWEKTIKQYWH